MKKMSIVVMALCAIWLSACATASASNSVSGDVEMSNAVSVGVDAAMNFRGWYPWGGLQSAANGNNVSFNGNVGTAGYVTENLDKALKNKRVLLEIKNALASNFSEERMMKIAVNKDDQTVCPLGISNLIQGEYIPLNTNRWNLSCPKTLTVNWVLCSIRQD